MYPELAFLVRVLLQGLLRPGEIADPPWGTRIKIVGAVPPALFAVFCAGARERLG
jgi:hypothetical protein